MILLLYIFIAVIIIQVFFFLSIFSKLANYSVQSMPSSQVAVSVIICARNEADNLKSFLPNILNQDYSNFEVIVVNDGSSDNTETVLRDFKSKELNLKCINTDKFLSHGDKKQALSLGIKAAKYRHLLLTDADCNPSTKNWISEMARRFETKTDIVLGYGAYRKIDNSWLNKYIRFETLLTAIQYFSYAIMGQTYMGVGRNLAYTRQLFLESDGFKFNDSIKSGDDDLFISEVASRENTSICISKSSFTISEPKTTFKGWVGQKRRHITTSVKYKAKHQLILGLFYVSQILFYSLGLLLLVNLYRTEFVLILVLFRFASVILIYYLCAKKLDEKDLLPFLPILEIGLIVFQLYIFILNIFNKPVNWS